MSDKVWVILEREFEYNDESYDASESGNCLLAYHSEVEADSACKRMMVESVRAGETYMYRSESALLYNSEESNALLQKYGYTRDDLWYHEKREEFFEALSMAPEDDIITLVDHLIYPLYYVQDVEVE